MYVYQSKTPIHMSFAMKCDELSNSEVKTKIKTPRFFFCFFFSVRWDGVMDNACFLQVSKSWADPPLQSLQSDYHLVHYVHLRVLGEGRLWCLIGTLFVWFKDLRWADPGLSENSPTQIDHLDQLIESSSTSFATKWLNVGDSYSEKWN